MKVRDCENQAERVALAEATSAEDINDMSGWTETAKGETWEREHEGRKAHVLIHAMRTLDRFKQHKILDPEDIPRSAHFVVLVFDMFRYDEPGYDQGDPSRPVSLPIVSYYSFVERSEWERMISEFMLECAEPTHSARPKIAFVHVSSPGHATVKINIHQLVA